MKLDIARKQEELRAFGQADSPTADILRQEIAVGEYQLAHNIPPYSEHSVFGFMNSAVVLTSIIGVLLIFLRKLYCFKGAQYGNNPLSLSALGIPY
ncbi:hypothetical protein GCM10020331_074690 [Ectobacillus funiculus]